jgi:hypothetical protein
MASETTPAETLRSAAKLMRKRAEAATRGPWTTSEKHGRDIADEGFSDVRVTSAAGDVAIAYYSNLIEPDADDAEHIASWHPLVALAVAGWLEWTAADADDAVRQVHLHTWSWRYCDNPAGIESALRIARLYLGEVSDA